MANSMIAVQIANGAFVPILDTSSRKRRRLVVTTVRDNQTSVKVELYRGSDESMTDPEYVGSLLIANIEPAAGGSPDVAVLLGIDETGNLNATATDTKSGEYQSLSVNLNQLERDGGYDMPDFQLSDDELTIDDLEEADDAVEPPVSSLSGTRDASGSSSGGTGALEGLADDEFPFDDSFADELSESRASGDDEVESFETAPDADLVEADLGDEDFTFDDGDEIHDTLSREEFDRIDAEPRGASGTRSDFDEEIRPRRSNAFVFVGYLLLALAALAVLAYLVFRLLEGPPAPSLRVGPIGEMSVALLLLGIPARRVSKSLQRRQRFHNKR